MPKENEVQHINEQMYSNSEALQKLLQKAAIQYKDVVNNILNDKIINEHGIEKVMNEMLSFCQIEEMQVLFKKLCRGTYPKYPQLVYDYTSYYREMWDDE